MSDSTSNSGPESLVPENYLAIAEDARKERDFEFKRLLRHGKLPHEGWGDFMIEHFINELASLDSNNFRSKCGVGEREGRIICGLVRQRHYYFAHGIGRSGNLTEAQPKAVGSTMMTNLTNRVVRDWIRSIGIRSCGRAIVVPMATGMTVMLTLLAIHSKRPKAKFVLWSRVDQQSCFKAILAAGLTPVIIDSVLAPECSEAEPLEGPHPGPNFATDLPGFVSKIVELGPDQICCILSTTSCFAPRGSDDVIELAKLCNTYGIPHVVNNAYGLQSSFYSHQIKEGAREGRIDAFIQSTDKNLLVPVGGAIVAGVTGCSTVDDVASLYPGRASESPSLDALMTLLSLGSSGYWRLLDEREELHRLLLTEMMELAQSHNERILPCKNTVSIAMTLTTFRTSSGRLEMIGSMLHKRGVSGCRVVTTEATKIIGGHSFARWGAHSSTASVPYLTASASLGMERGDVTTFLCKLDEVLHKYRRKYMARES